MEWRKGTQIGATRLLVWVQGLALSGAWGGRLGGRFAVYREIESLGGVSELGK